MSFVPQITSQPQVLGSTGNVPFQTQESSVPVGTGDTSNDPGLKGGSKNSVTIGTPVSRNDQAAGAGRITIPGKSLRTDGIHRKYILPEGAKGELADARTRNSKVFLKEDGHYVSVITENSLHYQDKDGKWQDIDSRLKTSSLNGFAFENTANRFQTLFADKGKDKLLRFQYGDKWLELNPLNRNETAPVVNGDTITYPNIYNGILLGKFENAAYGSEDMWWNYYLRQVK